jgi:hypothetical protein
MYHFFITQNGPGYGVHNQRGQVKETNTGITKKRESYTTSAASIINKPLDNIRNHLLLYGQVGAEDFDDTQ